MNGILTRLSMLYGKRKIEKERNYAKEAKKLDVYHISIHGKSKGLMNGRRPKEVIDFYNRISLCVCGGTPVVIQLEGMGDFDLIIRCSKCNRGVQKNMYAGRKPGEYEEMCIREWNNGEDISAEGEENVDS